MGDTASKKLDLSILCVIINSHESIWPQTGADVPPLPRRPIPLSMRSAKAKHCLHTSPKQMRKRHQTQNAAPSDREGRRQQQRRRDVDCAVD